MQSAEDSISSGDLCSLLYKARLARVLGIGAGGGLPGDGTQQPITVWQDEHAARRREQDDIFPRHVDDAAQSPRTVRVKETEMAASPKLERLTISPSVERRTSIFPSEDEDEDADGDSAMFAEGLDVSRESVNSTNTERLWDLAKHVETNELRQVQLNSFLALQRHAFRRRQLTKRHQLTLQRRQTHLSRHACGAWREAARCGRLRRYGARKVAAAVSFAVHARTLRVDWCEWRRVAACKRQWRRAGSRIEASVSAGCQRRCMEAWRCTHAEGIRTRMCAESKARTKARQTRGKLLQTCARRWREAAAAGRAVLARAHCARQAQGRRAGASALAVWAQASVQAKAARTDARLALAEKERCLIHDW